MVYTPNKSQNSNSNNTQQYTKMKEKYTAKRQCSLSKGVGALSTCKLVFYTALFSFCETNINFMAICVCHLVLLLYIFKITIYFFQ